MDASTLPQSATGGPSTDHPPTLLAALHFRSATQIMYADARRTLAVLIGSDIDLEDRTGRERRACARSIAEELQAAGQKVPSDSALSALAGDHPRYVALRVELAAVKQARAVAESLSDTLARQLDLCDLYVQTHLRMAQFNGDAHAVLQQWLTENAG